MPDNTTITFKGTDYEIKPLGLVSGIRVLNILRIYLARGAKLTQVFMQRIPEESDYERFSRAFAAMNDIVGPEDLERDIVNLLHLTTGIDHEILVEMSLETVIDALPAIFEGSRIASIVRKALDSMPDANATMQHIQNQTPVQPVPVTPVPQAKPAAKTG